MQKINVIVEGQLLNPIPGLPPDGGGPLPIDPPLPSLPPRTPYFRVGEAAGKPGEVVEVPVFGGCSGAMKGFYFACGMGGWGNMPQGVTLSKYLSDYTEGTNPYESFQYVGAEQRALPEAYLDYHLGLFSTGGGVIAPIPIPPDTELFRISLKIAEDATPGQLVLTCRDEYFYTHYDQLRRNLLYTNDAQGYSKIDCFDGKLTVTA